MVNTTLQVHDEPELTFPPIPTRKIGASEPVVRDEKSKKVEPSSFERALPELRSHLEATVRGIVAQVGPPTLEGHSDPRLRGTTRVRCPVHNDEHPSLQVTEDKNGYVNLFCESQNCKSSKIWNALGFNHPKGVVDEVYTYHNASGEPVFRKVRYAPWPREKEGRKRFGQERWSNGDWLSKLDGLSAAQKNIPYHLPQLLKAFEKARANPSTAFRVLVVEGEKCVRAVEAAGCVATTKYTGAQTGWPDGLTAHFKTAPSNVQFIVIGDADPVGRKQVRLATKALRSVDCNVKFLTVPEYAECDDGEDIADWLKAGHTSDELLALLETALPATDENLGSEQEADAPAEHPHEPWLDRLTDMVTGQLFAKRHRASIRWCEDQNTWLVWNGKRWRVGAQSLLDSMAVETMSHLREEALKLPARKRKHRLREIDRYEARGHLQHMVEQAKHLVVVGSDKLDTHRHLINLKNGTLNLHTGELQEFRCEDFITKIAPVSYDADAKCEKFDAWLNQTFSNDESLITYVQQLLGWSLEGDPGSRKIAFGFDNRGRTGKTTLLGKTIPAVLGEYAAAFSVGLFSRSKYSNADAAQPGLVALRNARYAFAAESKEHRLDLELVKQMTGGDAVTARALYSSPVTFTPECKFFVYGNRLPEIPDGDSAWWERVQVVPFQHQIQQQNVHYFDSVLQPELNGVFAWLFRGHQALRANNYALPDCEAVCAATRQYESQEDVLAQFIDADCEIQTDGGALTRELYIAYKGWCEENGHQPMGSRKFSMRLRERGHANVASLGPRQNARGFKGIRLREPASPAQTASTEEAEF